MIEVAVLAETIFLGWYIAIYGLSRSDILSHLLGTWQGKACVLILLLLAFALFQKSKRSRQYDDDAGDAFFADDDGD